MAGCRGGGDRGKGVLLYFAYTSLPLASLSFTLLY